jgi:hypothetical protein
MMTQSSALKEQTGDLWAVFDQKPRLRQLTNKELENEWNFEKKTDHQRDSKRH